MISNCNVTFSLKARNQQNAKLNNACELARIFHAISKSLTQVALFVAGAVSGRRINSVDLSSPVPLNLAKYAKQRYVRRVAMLVELAGFGQHKAGRKNATGNLLSYTRGEK